ncbi:rictor [Schizosaccharomyces cryophilus OY26]|uniref:Rictor n=1 Tax=Schizosaccharomyces cryophilus (strain OY26 / ATCC MYA-4695 / CBS 11777 / NBRC 106824 / NRRL Y48691) TaxID=653667 RepID=S9VV54_SCHCR|nr:rictor [Schizosaccharomyces cryophilus OY26]EPY51668.1 rictor [Schizosaccharomyces cryophilus OY26]
MRPMQKGPESQHFSANSKETSSIMEKLPGVVEENDELIDELKRKLDNEYAACHKTEQLLMDFGARFKHEPIERRASLKDNLESDLESCRRSIEKLKKSIENIQMDIQNEATESGISSWDPSLQKAQSHPETHTRHQRGNSRQVGLSLTKNDYLGPSKKLDPIVTQYSAIDKDEERRDKPLSVYPSLHNRIQFFQSNEAPNLVLQDWTTAVRNACSKLSTREVIQLSNDICQYLHEHPEKDCLPRAYYMLPTLHFMLMLNVPDVSACVYRVIRNLLTDPSAFAVCQSLNLTWLLSKSIITVGPSYETERAQAFRLIRTLYAFSSTEEHEHMLLGITNTLIAICEHSTDASRGIASETLIELMILKPQILLRANGLRVLISSLVDGSISEELAATAALALIYLLDNPVTCRYLSLPHDIGILLSPFTSPTLYDLYSPSGGQPEQTSRAIRSSAKVISVLLNSWPGLLAFSTEDFQALRSLVDSLRVPTFSARNDIIDLFLLIFKVDCSTIHESCIIAGKKPFPAKSQNVHEDIRTSTLNLSDGSYRNFLSLNHHFMALILFIFLELGLVESIVCVIRANDDQFLSKKATCLLGEVLRLSDQLLPIQLGAKIQSLPSLFNMASKFTAEDRFVATSVLQSIESLNRVKCQTETGFHASSIHEGGLSGNTFRGQRQVEHVKLKMGLQIDDSHFRNMLAETNVLTTKNYQKWRWDTLAQIMEGPLLSHKRIDETLRTTKFMKRLLSFYKPFSDRFSSIENTTANQKYINVGCLVFKTLLANPEGVKYLSESKLIKQIAEALSQLDEYSGQVANPIFSSERLETTLVHGYFCMLKVLSSQKEGHAIMERWRIFTTLYHIAEIRNRDDLLICLLTNVDYRLEGHSRIIFSKALSTAQQNVRLHATRHLLTLINSESGNDNLNHWAISLLIFQLYDPSLDVCQVAVKALDDVCAKNENLLAQVVQLQPSLAHLGEIGSPLLLRFLATTVGFYYLSEINFIEHELENWFYHRNEAYVDLIELNGFLTFISNMDIASAEISTNGDDILPLHFYGELVKSPEGCSVLETSGHFGSFMNILREYVEEVDSLQIRRLKSALWAIGNIGKAETGVHFLDKYDSVPLIVKFAEESKIPTVRGTAFFVLGLISRTSRGVQILSNLHWYSLMSLMGTSQGVCIPVHACRVISTPGKEAEHLSDRTLTYPQSFLADNLTNIEKEVVKYISNLSNHVLANESARQLTKIRSKTPRVFLSKRLAKFCFNILDQFHYRVQILQFIYELFPHSALLASFETNELPPRFSASNSSTVS